MKQVYIATYAPGIKRKTKVFGENAEDAKNAAYAAYTYMSAPHYPGPDVSDIVKSVELDPDGQIMSGYGIQPCVQVDFDPPVASEILAGIFQANR